MRLLDNRHIGCLPCKRQARAVGGSSVEATDTGASLFIRRPGRDKRSSADLHERSCYVDISLPKDDKIAQAMGSLGGTPLAYPRDTF